MAIQLLNIRKFAGPDGPLAKHILGGSRDATSEVQLGPDGTALAPVVDLLPAVGEERPYQVRVQAAKLAIAVARALPTAGRKPQPCIGVIAAGPPTYGSAEAWDQDRIMAWATQTVQWFRECAPHAVVTAATLHQDETRPHVHVLAVARSESGHVGWGRILPGFGRTLGGGGRRDPQRMREMQSRYHTEVAAPFGLLRDRGDGPHTYALEPDRQKAELDRAAVGRYSDDYLAAAGPEVRKVAEMGAEVRALTAQLDGRESRLPPGDAARLAITNSRLRGKVDGLVRSWPTGLEARLENLEKQVESLTQERNAALATADQATAKVGADRLTIGRQGRALAASRQMELALTTELAEVKADWHKLVQAVSAAETALHSLPSPTVWRGQAMSAVAEVVAWVRQYQLPERIRLVLQVVDQMVVALPVVGEHLDRALSALGPVRALQQEPRPLDPRLPSESRPKPKLPGGRW